ncbi:class I SAM-dependent methyltransferase [Azospirillum canadense]|uniref:class I SAM-dependent methyltransferase n=1 Tax=Azospirillum canadense TaxID=403962 RepID=UPI0022269890|nr:class I SAM-dependent methyltransferase [Azospirillum canadense]MCW2242512.1 SAM-dependent methyltransferase [Azospirillum canadense]
MRAAATWAARNAVLWSALVRLQNTSRRGDPWLRVHPFDADYGTRTSGYIPAWLLRAGRPGDAGITAYAGCQPSCLRAALRSIPNLESRSFLDLGCGKGRSTIIASEHPFRAVVGVDISPHLVRIARRNAAIVAKRFPHRPPVTIAEGDALDVPLPDGDLLVFIYHSFGPDVLARVIDRLGGAVAREARDVFVVYENPVYGTVIDRHRAFRRWFAEHVLCDPAEAPFQSDDGETIVVWRSSRDGRSATPSGADRPIVVSKPGWRAELADTRPAASALCSLKPEIPENVSAVSYVGQKAGQA